MNLGMFLVLTLFFIWFFRTVKEALFLVYLWQLKEYRLDRMKVHLTTLEGKRQILTPFLIAKLLLLLSSVILANFNLFFPFLFILYLMEMGFVFYQKNNLGLRRPKFTPKAVLLSCGSLILATFLLLLLLVVLSFIWIPTEFFLISFPVLDLLLFPLVSFLVLALKPATYILKEIVIRRAKKKIGKFPHLLVIGVTGSYGKTSTKEFLAQILAKKYQVLKTPGSHNTDIGIAKVILSKLKPKHEVFVVEMGAYKRGEIEKICEIVSPKIGVLTGISEQHLALFGNLKNICQAKFELIEALPPDGLAVFNGDDRRCWKLAKKTKTKVKFYSMEKKADIFVQKVRVKQGKIEFEVKANQETARFQASLLGKQNVPNILAATTVALNLGIPLKKIAKIVSQIKPFEKTMKPLRGIKETVVVDDSFSSNPIGFQTAVEYLKIFKNRRRFLVTPGIIELGPVSGKVHQTLGKVAVRVCSKVFLTSPNFAESLRAGAKQIGQGGKIIVEENPRRLVKKLLGIIKKDDVILLEGRVPGLIKKFLISNA